MKHRTLIMTIVSLSVLPVGSPASSAPGTGALFGTDAAGGNLISVDPGTGAGAVIGSMGAGVVPALAVDPTTGIMYAGQGGGAPNLYTVDPATGSATFVGDSGLGNSAIGGMDFRSDGVLFAAVNIVGDGGTGSDHLATIDTSTGVATIVGPFGSCMVRACTIEGIEGIAFDLTGTLWGSLSARGAAGSQGLYAIDTSTGAATFLEPIVDAGGAAPSGGVVSLQFGCDGTLYGGTATAIGEAGDGGRLITIDPATGTFAFVGGVSATGFTSLGALAFLDPCAVEFTIDIKPGSDPNSVNLRSRGLITVAVITSPDFDATTVDPLTICFGDAENPAQRDCSEAHGRGHLEDVDGDGDLDLVLHFRTQQTGIDSGDTEACLTGETFDGQSIEGCDSVRIVGRKG